METIQHGDDERDLTDGEDAELDSLTEQLESLDSQREAMYAALRTWSSEQRAVSGVVLYVGDDGELPRKMAWYAPRTARRSLLR